jgi:hypothetical protein
VTTALVCGLITLLLLGYVFYPERNVARQQEKSRLEFLEERRAVLFDNLRDLNFEYRAGKYREDEYARDRDELEHEAAAVVDEIEQLGGGARSR